MFGSILNLEDVLAAATSNLLLYVLLLAELDVVLDLIYPSLILNRNRDP